jgi:hypothetical protein
MERDWANQAPAVIPPTRRKTLNRAKTIRRIMSSLDLDCPRQDRRHASILINEKNQGLFRWGE